MADKKTTLMAQFYEQCQTKGYTDMSDATQSLKAKVIASDLKLNYGNIVEFYAKAKNCYDRVQEEKAEEARKAEIGRKAQEEENARRAVGGEWLVTIYGAGTSSSDKAEVKVYVRPDGSVYSIIGNSAKIEGAPAVNVLRGAVLTMTYHPSQAVYTGATVGGITTGGVHYTQASYSEKASNTDTGSIQISVNGKEFLVKRFVVSVLTKSKFKRDSAFCNYASTGETQCYRSSGMGDLMREAAFMQNVQYTDRINMLSRAADEDRLPYNTCAEIADLLGRIANAQFPPSDEEVYAAAEALAAKTTSAEVKRAVETFRNISDYRDASQRAKAAEEKYEELLQEEKEQAILAKEATAKTRKKLVMILVPLIAVTAIVAMLMVKIIIPNTRYTKAHALMDAAEYDEAIATFESLGDYKDSSSKIVDCTYAKAVALMDAAEYDEAITVFKELGDYKDSGAKVTESTYAKAVALMDAAEYDKAIHVFETLGDYEDSSAKIIDCTYAKAAALMDAAEYEEAIVVFESLSGYKDSREKISVCIESMNSPVYAEAIALLESGDAIAAKTLFSSLGDYKDSQAYLFSIWDQLAARKTISAGESFTVGVKTDGTVLAAVSDEADRYDIKSGVSNWTDIIAVSAGKTHVVGLKADGTVVATGNNYNGQCNVSGWKDIVAISAGEDRTIGLKADGTVVCTKSSLSRWDVVAISAGEGHIICLKEDGTVDAHGSNQNGQSNVEDWKDIVAICTGSNHTVGLKANGTLVAIGNNYRGQCSVSGWKDVVAISAGGNHTVGLKADGTVLATGYNEYGEGEVRDWTDIVAICAGINHTVGLKADGTVVAVGFNGAGQCNVGDWNNIRLPNS